MIAADVFSTKPRSGLSAHRKTCTGSAVAGSVGPDGRSTTKATMPTMSNGADSPSARAMPMIAPVRIRGIASGNRKCETTCTSEAPTARAASLIEGGIPFSAARVVMMIVGRVIRARVRPPTTGAERGRCMTFRKTASPSRPKTIEGTAARLLMLTSMMSTHRRFGANSSRKTAAPTPVGNDTTRVTRRIQNDPRTAPPTPASSGSRESPLTRKVQLKTVARSPSCSRASTQAIVRSSISRSFSGAERST